MKTIFITITRGFIVKNVLRSGGLNELKKRGYRIVIFLACREVPEYIKDEFAGDQVILIADKNYKPILCGQTD